MDLKTFITETLQQISVRRSSGASALGIKLHPSNPGVRS
jgi:hypothetical protein